MTKARKGPGRPPKSPRNVNLRIPDKPDSFVSRQQSDSDCSTSSSTPAKRGRPSKVPQSGGRPRSSEKAITTAGTTAEGNITRSLFSDITGTSTDTTARNVVNQQQPGVIPRIAGVRQITDFTAADAFEIVNNCALDDGGLERLIQDQHLYTHELYGYLCYIAKISNRSVAVVSPQFSLAHQSHFISDAEKLMMRACDNMYGDANSEIVLIPIGHFYGAKKLMQESVNIGHWTIGIFDRNSNRILYYDSLQNPEPVNQFTISILQKAMRTIRGNDDHKNYAMHRQHFERFNRQQDGASCGYLVCLNAEQYCLRGEEHTYVENLDMKLLRGRFYTVVHSLLNGSIAPYQVPQQPPRRSTRLAKSYAQVASSTSTVAKSVTNVTKGVTTKLQQLSLVSPRCHSVTHPGMCASKSINHYAECYSSGSFSEKCSHCNALLLPSEKKTKNFKKCCKEGLIDLEQKWDNLQDTPDLLRHLTEDPKELFPEVKEFKKNVLMYNSELAFGSIGSDKCFERLPVGPPIIRMNGKNTYNVSDISPAPGGKPRFAQHYPVDPEVSFEQRIEGGLAEKLNQDTLKNLDLMLREHHVFAAAYKNAHEIYDEHVQRNLAEGKEVPHFRFVLLSNREAEFNLDATCHLHRSESAAAPNIAVIWVNDEGEPPTFSGTWLEGKDGAIKSVPYFDNNIDPACFPLLFPRGQQGYSHNIHYRNLHRWQTTLKGDESDGEMDAEDTELDENMVGDNMMIVCNKKREFVSHREYARYIFQMRGRNCQSSHWLWSKEKLAEFYVADIENRIERNEMEFMKQYQLNLRSTLSSDLLEALEVGLAPGEKLGKVFFVPSSMKGSRRYMQAQYADFMRIIREFGNPHLFITFTGNPHWPELKESMFDGQEYYRRPDVVCRVFIDKANEFIKDLTERNIFGKVVAYIISVEHQKRGMPHLHCLLILHPETPNIETPVYVDQFISAEIPDLPAEEDHTPEAIQQRKLHNVVTLNNLHDCSERSLCRIDGKCSKKFPKEFSRYTILSTNSYPQYTRRAPMEDDLSYVDNDDYVTQYVRRPPLPTTVNVNKAATSEYGNVFYKKLRNGATVALDNRHVVPYNAYLSLKYNCHINVEYVWGQKCCNYVLKYIVKGHDLAYVRVTKDSIDQVDYDEFEHVLACRYMTSIEAFMRLWGFPVVMKSHSVEKLYVHGPNDIPVTFMEGYEEEAAAAVLNNEKQTKLLAFFQLCAEINCELRYDEVQTQFVWDEKNRKWKKGDFDRSEKLARVTSVSPKNNELYAIRLLLLFVKSPTSFEDLRTVKLPNQQPILCETFVEAARMYGLLDGSRMWIATLLDAADEMQSSRKFRRFFAMLILHGTPDNPKEIFETLLYRLVPPVAGKDDDWHRQTALSHIEYYLRRMNSCCSMLGLNEPENYDEGALEEMLNNQQMLMGHINDDRNDQPRGINWQDFAQQRINHLNAEQRRAFNRITQSILADNNDFNVKRCFFLDGAGGTGKTFLYNTLLCWAKANGRIIKPCASTGIAATLLECGATVHSTFWVPKELHSDTSPNIQYQHLIAQSLRETDAFIIDEIGMLHKNVMMYIDRVLRDIVPNGKNLPFGGKVMLIGGNWHQLSPVTPGLGPLGSVTASIKLTNLFSSNFETLQVTQNMRTGHGEADFAKYLTKVGSGQNFITGSEFIEPPSTWFVNSIEDLIEFCYRKEALEDPVNNIDELCGSAILSPRNVTVLQLNNLIIQRLRGEERTYLSFDTVNQKDPLHALSVHIADGHIEQIHRMLPTGMPPHQLTLKVGCCVMLIKNLDITNGLCNGTRLIILQMRDELLKCRIMTGSRRNSSDNVVFLPRIRFEYGNNTTQIGIPFTRLQFPVRPAFAMTINKAQGQTLDKVGLALNEQQVFSHGQLYVALSRVRNANSIAIFNGNTPKSTWIKNVIFNELLN